jgi:hypothetical protein
MYRKLLGGTNAYIFKRRMLPVSNITSLETRKEELAKPNIIRRKKMKRLDQR